MYWSLTSKICNCQWCYSRFHLLEMWKKNCMCTTRKGESTLLQLHTTPILRLTSRLNEGYVYFNSLECLLEEQWGACVVELFKHLMAWIANLWEGLLDRACWMPSIPLKKQPPQPPPKGLWERHCSKVTMQGSESSHVTACKAEAGQEAFPHAPTTCYSRRPSSWGKRREF